MVNKLKGNGAIMGKKCKGAVSIFMIIITFCSFMLGGVFIDGARILVARNKIQLSMDSAVRSTMSYYDEDLVSEYGLYGIDKNILNDKFKKYFEVNLQRTKYDGVNLFEYTIENPSMVAGESFSDSMDRQIKEYEKYRMPVTTTIVLVDRVKDSLSNLLKGVNKTKGAADAVKTLESKMSVASKNLGKYAKAIKTNVATNLKKAVASSVTTFLKNGAANATTAALGQSIDDHLKNARDEIEKMKTELKELKEKRDAYSEEESKLEQPSESDVIGADTSSEINAKREGDSIKEDFADTEDKINQEITDLENEINNLESAIFGDGGIEKRLKAEQGNMDTLIGEWRAAEIALTNAKAALSTAESNLAKEKQRLGITTAEKNVSQQKSKLRGIDSSLKQIFMAFESKEVKDDFEAYKLTFEDEDEEKKEQRAQLEEKYKDDDGVTEYFDKYKERIEAEKEVERLQAEVNRIKRQLSGFETAVTNAKNNVATCEENVRICKQNIENKSTQMQNIVAELENLVYPDFKEKVIDDLAESSKESFDAGVSTFLDGTSFDKIFNAFTLEMPALNPEEGDVNDDKGLIKMYENLVAEFSNLMKIITNPNDFVDQAMYIDYIMGKCTYLTSQTARNHYFEVAEVEYILFGNKTQVANVAATVASIYGMRFGINFINYLITTPGGFISRLAGALTRALAQSVLDIGDMLIARGEEAPGCALCPSAKGIKLTYSDHLRLLLLMKFTDSDMQSLEKTINSTLTNNYDGTSTTELSASATATADVGINLIMIPAFTDIMPLGDRFRDGKFFIPVSGYYAY